MKSDLKKIIIYVKFGVHFEKLNLEEKFYLIVAISFFVFLIML